MITIGEGRIGSGKSLDATEWALRRVARGGWVVSNQAFVFGRCQEYVRAKYKKEIRPEQLIFLDEEMMAEFWKYCPRGTAKPTG